MDSSEYVNPRKTLKRRELEAGAESASDGDGGTVAPTKKKPAPATEAAPAPAVKFTTGPRGITPEEQARRVQQFKALQRKQRAEII